MRKKTCRRCQHLSDTGRATVKYGFCPDSECSCPLPDWVETWLGEASPDTDVDRTIWPDDNRFCCAAFVWRKKDPKCPTKT